MAILENIRKRTTILILIIGLALFAFVISGVFTSGTLAGGGAKVSSSVAEINGDEISIDAFRKKIELASKRVAPSTSSMKLVNQVWDQEVKNSILSQQFEDLGIDIEEDQIMNYIKTIPSYSNSPQFQDENGVFDENKFRNFILEIKVKNPVQYQLWLQDEKSIIQNRKEQTYFNLVKAGVGATLKEGELAYKLANDKVDIKYVRVPYSSIPDSTVAVSENEIADYINEHQKEYKQEQARDIQFVYFEEKASDADIETVEEKITALLNDTVEYNSQTDKNDTIAGFKNATDIAAFLDRYSDNKYDTIYKAKKALPALVADTLMALSVGEIYGPYRDGDVYKVSKMVSRKPNGSVKASHILIAYEGAQRANPDVKRTKEEAESEAKKILIKAKKSNADFAALARENSDGPSASKGGDLGYFEEGKMVPEFSDFAFANEVGSIGLVETDFGFHVIKVDDKEDLVKIATLTRTVEASEETSNALYNDATKFEMSVIELDADYTAIAKESEYKVRPVNKIKIMDENLPGLSNQRSIVQWAFNDDTNVGDVKRFNINNGYAVVQLTAAYKEGLVSVEDASESILPKIRKERKAAQLIKKYEGKTLQDLAANAGVSVSKASALTVDSPTIPGVGLEPLVVGTAFGMNETSSPILIEGESGVFLVSVTKKEKGPKLDNYSTYANNIKSESAKKVNTAVYNALKEASEIEDKRAVFY